MLAREDFLPLAEEAGLIGPFPRCWLTASTTAAARWAAAGWPALMTVNVDPRLSSAMSLVDDVAAALTASGLPARRLGLKLAEPGLAEDRERIADQLHQLHALGMALFIDDFGAGGSPLGRLLTLPIAEAGPGLLAGEHDPAAGDRRDPLEALVALVTGMGADTLAEGIQTPQQLARAGAAGCHRGQGHLLAAPMPADRVLDSLPARNVQLRLGR